MPEIKATPDTLDRVGSQVVGLGRDIAGLKTKVNGLSKGVDDPPRTADALDQLTKEWSAGLDRLGESVGDVGRFTQGVGRLFALVEGLFTGSEDAK
ncbi:MAG: hypothetical protein M3N28_06125 [Actinomycetota bacterium]|nr:hypothetical protein [Actinomycetota bacterium]